MNERHLQSLRPQEEALRLLSRRALLHRTRLGLGAAALTWLLNGGRFPEAAAGEGSGRRKAAPHFRPRAKSVIHLFMAGGPSHIDLFDPKPLLKKYDGKVVPREFVEDKRYAFIRRDAKLMASPFRFERHGRSGVELSELLPYLGRVADDIAVVRSVHTDTFNHAPAQLFFNTGATLPGRPSMGAWVTYGLGSEAEDLPAFVVLSTGGGTSAGAANWGSGFLPTRYQGVPFRTQGDPVIDLSNPPGVDRRRQRASIELITELNRMRLGILGDPEIATRIASYELAYRMQASAPELMDISREPRRVLEMYGAEPGKVSFANNCLLARRLVERGVRFVSVFHKGWDHHSDVAGGLRHQCGLTDRATAALIRDLKERGLLDTTLVVWNGEFGRTPMVESNAALGRRLGRDHHPQAFSVWLAGGGIRGGITYGRTDDLGFHVVEDPVHVHDLQATILHLLGIDHTRLTFRFQGRDFRLTDVGGEVLHPLIV